jgi:hypothetical protein
VGAPTPWSGTLGYLLASGEAFDDEEAGSAKAHSGGEDIKQGSERLLFGLVRQAR